VSGRSDRAATLDLVLERAGRTVARRRLTVAAGPFSLPVRAPRGLLPGVHRLRIRDVGGILPERVITLRIKAPPEGVVDSAFASGIANGPPAAVLGPRPRIFANFHFAAVPARGRRITTRWYRGPAAIDDPVVRPRAAGVAAYLQVRRGDLPRGRYRCVLRAGGTVVAVASVRIR
jgi:hypothetical protein